MTRRSGLNLLEPIINQIAKIEIKKSPLKSQGSFFRTDLVDFLMRLARHNLRRYIQRNLSDYNTKNFSHGADAEIKIS